MPELSIELKDKINFADLPHGAPGKPNEKILYSLWFRENMNPHPLFKFFFHIGDLRSAIARGKIHCERVGARFIFVRPFLVDLDIEEKRIQGVNE